VRNVITTTTWMIHSTKVLEVFNGSEVTTVILGQEIESLMVNELSDDFKSNLITPSIDEGH
jgi:hypothetical protein